MARVYNFNAGPAILPEEVLRQAQNDLIDWGHRDVSILEMPHRGADFKQIAEETEKELRGLLNIPSSYHVLFLAGGARTQFAMAPMNFAAQTGKMAYIETGLWSQLAIAEARLYGDVEIVASSADNQFTELPPVDKLQIAQDAAYLHYTDNETVHGVEFSVAPDSQGLPLIADMSSNLLSRPVDVTKYGMIYACAQKNAGAAGITIVILREDLLQRTPFAFTPGMLRYQNQVEHASMYNTPPTFPWYLSGLVFKWVKKQGGVEKLEEASRKKSDILYQFIDQTDFYINPVKPHCRSRMNVVFTLAQESLEKQFLQEAEKGGLTNLKGHRAVGGVRASIYNAMPETGVESLVAFMRDFEKRYG